MPFATTELTLTKKLYFALNDPINAKLLLTQNPEMLTKFSIL